MTCDFPDLGSASDWLRQISRAARQSEAQPRIVDLDSDTSSVWNFSACFSDIISRGNEEVASRNVGFFSGYEKVTFNATKQHSHQPLMTENPT